MKNQSKWQKSETNNLSNFSTFGFGLAGTAMSYLGLSLLSNIVHIPRTVWFVGLPLLGLAVGVEYFSNRVLWRRVSQVVSSLTIAITYGLLLLFTLARGASILNQGIVSLVMLSTAISIYLLVAKFHRYYVANAMPHGSVGKLNQKTGLVDPNCMLIKDQEQLAQSVRRWGNASNLVPLFVGLVFLIIRMLPESGTTIVLSFSSFVGFFFGTLGVLGAGLSIFSICDWEQNNKAKIRLQQ